MADKQANSMSGGDPVSREPQGLVPKNPAKQAQLAKALRHNLQRRKQSQKANTADTASGE